MALGERVEIGELEVRARSEPMRLVIRGQLAVNRDGGRKGGGLRGRRKPDGVGKRKLSEKIVERSERQDFSVVDDSDLRAETRGLLHVVGRVDDREALVIQLLEELED